MLASTPEASPQAILNLQPNVRRRSKLPLLSLYQMRSRLACKIFQREFLDTPFARRVTAARIEACIASKGSARASSSPALQAWMTPCRGLLASSGTSAPTRQQRQPSE
jgi:hypothetical protein